MLLLVFSHLLDVWVYLQVQRCQEALVDCHFLDCRDSRGATTKPHWVPATTQPSTESS